MEHVRVLGDDADRVVQRRERDVADVVTADPHLAVHGVVEPSHQAGDGGLAGAGRADQSGHRRRPARRTRRRAAPAGWAPGRAPRPTPATRATPRRRSGSGTTRRAARPRWARGGRSLGVGLLVDHRRQVEHLEDPLEADQGGHDVDLHVGQRGERAVQPAEQGGQRHQRAEGDGVVDGEHATDAVDQRGGQRGDQGEAGEEDPAVHRLLDADVADLAGLARRRRPTRRAAGRTA